MITIKESVEWFKTRGCEVIFNDQVDLGQTISRPMAIDDSDENHITFINKKLAANFKDLLKATKCKLIILERTLVDAEILKDFSIAKILILSDNPKKELIEFSKSFFIHQQTPSKYIHESSCISSSARLGNQTKIGAFVVIESGVSIGNRCSIGHGTIIKSNTTIGDDVVIGACNVIGGDGFGYTKNEETKGYDQFPHFGKVIIKDKVHIGSNSCIDRGSLKDTVIDEGVKIDNLVHIAHNVHIGKNSLIIACSMIAGSVVIGENSWVAPSSAVRNAITIGKNTTIGIGSTVTKSVPDNETVLGSPAIPLDEFMRLRKLQKDWIEKNKQ